MPPPESQDRAPELSRRLWLGGLGALALGSGLLLHLKGRRRDSGVTVHLLLPERPTALLPHQVGLQWVVRALLECRAQACVAEVPPDPAVPIPMPAGCFQIRLQSRREGDRLALPFQWRRPVADWVEVPGPLLPPGEAIADFLGRLPFGVDRSRLDRSLPAQPAQVWELLELVPRRVFTEGSEVWARVRALQAAAPRASLVWCLGGLARAERLALRQDWSAADRTELEESFRQAQALESGLPVATVAWAKFLSNLGDPVRSLEILAQGLRTHPYSEALLNGLAYSARNAGVLDLAQRALLRRERLIGFLCGIENTLLYRGEYARFEEGLRWELGLHRWAPAHRFYLGYSALLQGRPEEALQRLRETGQAWGGSRFGRAGDILQKILEGRKPEARQALDALAGEHLGLRSPDGEFILKLGEFMILLGDANEGMDLAVRATAQGFFCAEWLEQNPLLAPIRTWPRFQAILHGLRERAALHARRFPPAAFGL